MLDCFTLRAGTPLPGLAHAALPEVQVKYAPIVVLRGPEVAQQQVLPASFYNIQGGQDHTWTQSGKG